MSPPTRRRAPTGVCVVRVEPQAGQGVLISITADPDIEAHITPRQTWHFREVAPAVEVVEAFLHLCAELPRAQRTAERKGV